MEMLASVVSVQGGKHVGRDTSLVSGMKDGEIGVVLLVFTSLGGEFKNLLQALVRTDMGNFRIKGAVSRVELFWCPTFTMLLVLKDCDQPCTLSP